MIRSATAEDRDWVRAFVASRWGGDRIVAYDTEYVPSDLPGLIAEADGVKTGLLSGVFS